MRLLKVIFHAYSGTAKSEVLVEVGRGALTLLCVLENSSHVSFYRVYDMSVMCETKPEMYGWGDLPKWDYMGVLEERLRE